MAQWIPKTAWKANNLNKRYGFDFVGVFSPGSKVPGTSVPPPNFFSSTSQPQRYVLDEFRNTRCYTNAEIAQKYFTEQRPFLDVRDDVERQFEPLKNAVGAHHHDLLSGAMCPVLPNDRSSEIFVVASSRQRGVNGFNALRRWGYTNVVVIDYKSLKEIESSRD